MFTQLAIGSIIVSLTFGTAAVFMTFAFRFLTGAGPWLTQPPHTLKTIIFLIGVTLWLLTIVIISVWLWAAAFFFIGIFTAFEPAVYFAIVSFTTLGLGGIIPPVPWRLLSGICAANGMLLFGLSAAFLVEFFRELMKAQAEHVRRKRAK